jgi:hypothetical protein
MLSWQRSSVVQSALGLVKLVAAGYKHAYFSKPPIVNAPPCSSICSWKSPRAEQVDVEAGVEYQNMDEMRTDAKSLGCDAVVNCTGLGAKAL